MVTCSALKRAYRDELLDGRPQARLVFLAVDRDVVARRLAARHGHFFPVQLLDSQFAALEPVGPGERAVSIVPADDPVQTVADIIAVFRLGADPGSDARAAPASPAPRRWT